VRLVFCKQIDGADVTERVNGADFIRVEFSGISATRVEIELADLSGRKLIHMKENAVPGFNRFELDMRDIRPGHYLVTVKAGNTGPAIFPAGRIIKK